MADPNSLFGVTRRKGFYAGVEFEIESVKEVKSYVHDCNINVTEDTSLRNYGMELITSPESNITTLAEYHKNIFDGTFIAFHDRKEACSDRCSTHVHVNVSDLDEKWILNMTYLYYLMEPLFYRFVQSEREHNIYCVPLSWTVLPNYFERIGLEPLISKWTKYTGYNLRPIAEHGSIEFRHMEATLDNSKFKRWLEIIASWYNVGKTVKIDIETLDKLDWLVGQVFKPEELPDCPLNDYLNNSVLDLKIAFINPNHRWK